MTRLKIVVQILIFFCFKLVSQDTLVENNKNYKLSRKAFILKYASNDTTLREAINLYFDKRSAGRIKLLSLPISVVIVGASSLLYSSNHRQASNLSSYGMVFGGLASAVSIPYFINGVKILKKYNRKDLYHGILQVKSGIMSSEDFYKKIEEIDVRK